MLLKELGSEFELLRRILRPESPEPALVLPNGDDAAVVRLGSTLIALSTDTIMEGCDFRLSYFTPEQVGAKGVEAAVSDIVAVGGKPRYVLIAICLPERTQVETIAGIYRGIYAASDRLNSRLVGGDTTLGSDAITLSVTVIGVVESEEHLCSRSGAEEGDLVCVTGPVGGASAGLRLLEKGGRGYEDLKRCVLSPFARVDLVDSLCPYATSLIDISDGLSSELHHIARESEKGIIISEEKIPIRDSVSQVASMFGERALDYVYNGGEEFELLYTIAPKDRGYVVGYEIGKVINKQGVFVEREGKRESLANTGYDILVAVNSHV